MKTKMVSIDVCDYHSSKRINFLRQFFVISNQILGVLMAQEYKFRQCSQFLSYQIRLQIKVSSSKSQTTAKGHKATAEKKASRSGYSIGFP